MGSFGERMQREREMRTVTLDEIAESTKIGTRMLHALEEEDFAKLPGGIFNKGFVRAYARYLGLDEEQAVTDFMTAYAEFQAEAEHLPLGASMPKDASLLNSGDTETVSSIQASTDPSQALPAGFIVAAIILIVVLGAGGFFFKYYQSKKFASVSPATVTRSKVEKKKMQAEVPASHETVAAIPSASPASDNSSSGISSVLAASAQPISNPAETSYPEYSREPSPVTADAAQGSGKKKLNLQIRTKEESWVKITADGQILMEGILSPTASRQFRAAKELIVKLGNAGVVELSYNGKLMPPFSPDTKTKTLTFTADGLSSE